MKEITCENLDVLKGTGEYQRLRHYVTEYQKKHAIGIAVSVLFFPFVFAMTVVFFLFEQFIGLLLITVIKGALESMLSGFLSNAVAFLISNVFFWVAETLLVFPFALFSLLILLLFYNSLTSVLKRDSNVSEKLFIADNMAEIEYATMPGRASWLVYSAFKYLWDNSFGVFQPLKIDNIVGKVYGGKGAVISRAPAKTFAFTGSLTDFGKRLPRAWDIRMEESGRYVIFKVYVKTADGKAQLFGDVPEIIAVVDGKYKDELVERINGYAPDTIKTVK